MPTRVGRKSVASRNRVQSARQSRWETATIAVLQRAGHLAPAAREYAFDIVQIGLGLSFQRWFDFAVNPAVTFARRDGASDFIRLLGLPYIIERTLLKTSK